jgi:signal transduction histidine kinase/ligand-binding sensor domain-containing protein/AraC-like DNA-binding protein
MLGKIFTTINLFILAGVSNLFSQETYVKTLSEAEGLSQGYVTSLFQDRRGFVWIGTLYGLNRYDGYHCKPYLPNHLDPFSLHANIITCINEDKNGLIWVGTDEGLFLFDPYTEKFLDLAKVTPNEPTGTIRDVILDDQNNVWCYARTGRTAAIYVVQNKSNLVQELRKETYGPQSLKVLSLNLPDELGNQINLFAQTSPNTCLIANLQKQFFNLNLAEHSFQRISNPLNTDEALLLPAFKGANYGSLLFHDSDIQNMIPPEKRVGYLKTPDGTRYICQFYDQHIYQLNTPFEKTNSTIFQSSTIFSTLPQPHSWARMVDKHGNIWMGTIGGGVQIISILPNTVKKIFSDINFCNPARMPNQQVWAGMYSQDKWIDPIQRQLTEPIWKNQLAPNQSVNSALYVEEERAIYLLLNNSDKTSSFSRYDLPTRQLETVLPKVINYTTDPVMMLKDYLGNIWIAGSSGQLIRFNPASKQTDSWNYSSLFSNIVHPGQLITRSIVEDLHHTIWIGNDYGLVKIKLDKGLPQMKAYFNTPNETPVFKANGIFSVYPDKIDSNLLWLGTISGGLAQFNIRTEQITYIPSGHPSKFDIVLGLLPDSSNNLWLSTNKGLFCYRPKTNIFADFSQLEYIPTTDFNAAARLNLDNNQLLFGGNNGLLLVQPEQVRHLATEGAVQLTTISINRLPSIHPENIGKVKFDEANQPSIQLAHDDFSLTIGFALPMAANTEILLYRYKMEGLSNEWINIGQEHLIEFSGLKPGDYRLQIQALHATDNWENAANLSIAVIVHPPWYFSGAAYGAYLLLIMLGTRSLFIYQRKQLARTHQADLDRKEKERLQSLDTLKNRFFAYIAHEFKSPLTIILGGVKQIQRDTTEENKNITDSILKQGNDMLQLIDEMIGVTQLQDNTIRPNYEHRDIVPFLTSIVHSYFPLTELDEIELEFKCDVKSFEMDFDRFRTQYILNNLISNAIQHTPAKGRITVSLQPLSNNLVELSVKDTGSGIHPSDLPFIFDKYYRANSNEKNQHNFGLGLSFLKELTQLLKGQIQVDSQPGNGSVFSIILPVIAPEGVSVKTNLIEEITYQHIETDTPSEAAKDAPSLLIVDDNISIHRYLKTLLMPHFRLLFANNGKDGLEMAIQEIPDLILSDVIMPQMDGIEMTSQIKAHPLTSHIPVILLSAKNEVTDRITGKLRGADAYIGKPFDDKELLFTLQNLYALQQNWKERYAKVVEGNFDLKDANNMPKEFDPFSVEQTDSFMQEVMEAFEKYYSKDNFDADELCKTLNVSKSQLYRKLSKISDQSVMELLRNYRLQKAIHLLQDYPELSTKEVAYQVGFKEHSHFSSTFKKRYGVSPSSVRKKSNL